MPTYTLIASNTLGSSAASVTFSSIPSTYTDLVLLGSTRTTQNDTEGTIKLTFNNDTGSNYSKTKLEGNGAGPSSTRESNVTSFMTRWYQPGSLSTSNTFGTWQIYIPNYTSTGNKPFSLDNTAEGNITDPVDRSVTAGLYRGSSAISTIVVSSTSLNLASGSSFFLYGIKNS